MTSHMLGMDALGYTEPSGNIVNLHTPARIKAEMDAVLREGEVLNRDIASFHTDEPAFPAFSQAWGAFWEEYKKFHREHASGVSGWFSRLWGTMMNRTIDYGRKLNDWRAKFGRFHGASPSEPAPVAIKRPEDPAAIPWRTVAVGAVIIGGVIAGGYALSKAGGLSNVWRRS